MISTSCQLGSTVYRCIHGMEMDHLNYSDWLISKWSHTSGSISSLANFLSSITRLNTNTLKQYSSRMDSRIYLLCLNTVTNGTVFNLWGCLMFTTDSIRNYLSLLNTVTNGIVFNLWGCLMFTTDSIRNYFLC